MLNPIVYCIIVTYNGAEWIEKCLNSVYASSYSLIPIVIDNNSNDFTVDIIEKKFPNCQLVKSKENLGFGQANNVGIEIAYKAGSDYFFLLNQDAWINEDAIGKLVKIAEENSFGIISPIHLNGAGNAFDIRFSTYISPSINQPNYTFFSDLYQNNKKEYYEVDFINAAAWLVSRKCIEKVGYFDSLFFHYGEDENYCHRVRYHNLKIVFCPTAVIFHDRDERVLKHDLSLEFKKRRLLIEFSNPLISDEIHQQKEIDLFKHYKRTMIKNRIRGKFDNAKQNKSMILFLKDAIEKAQNSRIRNKKNK
jgi:GT2 family glycosyltransferase